MNRAQTGFVLMTTVLMIAMLTVLIVSSMKALWLYVKASHQVVRTHDLFQKMERFASQVDVTHSTCTISDKTPNQLLEWLSTHAGCTVHDNGDDYRYLVGDSGDYPCLHIIQSGTHHSSHHWILTVTSPDLKEVFLQIRMALPTKKLSCEPESIRVIRTGVLSWRKISRDGSLKFN